MIIKIQLLFLLSMVSFLSFPIFVDRVSSFAFASMY